MVPISWQGRLQREQRGPKCHLLPGNLLGWAVPTPQADRALLTSDNEAVEGTPQRTVPHECGTVDTVFTDTDTGECQDNVVILHLTPVRGLVVGACKGSKGTEDYL